ncbi:fimbrial protein [Herbaspirillum rhizosphaerae]|uniref:Fimbrial protein n=1 Tax=Herbaspirillum rhizosphaerae TaxID=346179 RepID=A0ABW8Z2W9_9BURK
MSKKTAVPFLALVKRLTAMVLLGLFSQAAHAACSADVSRGEQQIGFTFPSSLINAPRDAPIGTVLASVTTNSETRSGGAWCQQGRTTVTLSTPLTNVIAPTSAGTSGLDGVFILLNPNGSNSGLGFRIVNTRNNTSNITGSTTFTFGACRQPGTSAAGGSSYCWGVFTPLGKRLEIVKTANGGGAPRLSIGATLLTGQAEGIEYVSFNLLNSSLSVVPQTCTVTQPGAVNMGAVPSKTFSGVGSTSGWGPDFTIGVNCSGVAAKVFMVLSDAQNSANTTSTLPLSSSSTATGVGFQIQRKNGSGPIRFGPDSSLAGTTNQFFVFYSAGNATGPTSLVFAARYIQTDATIKPGTANGLATFTMSYQ